MAISPLSGGNQPTLILDGTRIDWVHYTLSKNRLVYQDKAMVWHFIDIKPPQLFGDSTHIHTYHLTSKK